MILLLAALLAASAHEGGPAAADPPFVAMTDLVAGVAEHHDTDVTTLGRVAWTGCGERLCLWELLPPEGGPGAILVRGPAVPVGTTGQVVRVHGHFFGKIYPGYRLAEWQALGWRAGQPLPAQARLLRLDASEVEEEGEAAGPVGPVPALVPFEGGLFDLRATEYERAGTGTGRKCLPPGGETPRHSSGGNQELLFGLSGQLTAEVEGQPPAVLGPDQGLLIPPATLHGLRNEGSDDACYLFVYSVPSPG
ncbi:MAG: cupin domain-containing protein [Pseudomonadota bacterium]